MPHIEANGITICYDVMGPEDGRPLLLVMGLTTQLIAWPEPFCRMLADAGHRVIRFDNRDCGLSEKMEGLGVPDVMQLATDMTNGLDVTPPYTLSDMAADAVGLMDALGYDRFHLCGNSMGGMIAQTVAIEHPERLISLVSMQSTTGEPGLPPPSPEATASLFNPVPTDREKYIARIGDNYRSFAGGSAALDDAVQTELSTAAYDRAYYPMGFTRQMAAVMLAKGRRAALGAVACPTLVIHGTHDTLVPPAHGEDTANAIPGAAFRLIEGLGHGTAYPTLWREIAELISAHTAGAEGGR